MPFQFPAKFDGECDAALECFHGGRIVPGEPIALVYASGRKVLLHADCYARRYGKPLSEKAKPEAGPAAAPAAGQVTADGLRALADLLAPHLVDRVREATRECVDEALDDVAAHIDDQLAEVVQRAVASVTRRVVVDRGPDVPAKTFQHAHRLFPLLVQRLAQNQTQPRNVLLWGPAGSGKSHAAEQAARALDLPFAYMSVTPMSSPSQLVGYMTPGGEYVETTFSRMYGGGGVFCLDEIDNGSDNLLTALNSALAGEAGAFPCGMRARSPQFCMVAGANTALLGGDFANPERRRQGQAQRSRWTYINWDYDAVLERGLALSRYEHAGPWVDWVQSVRAWASDPAHGVRDVLATPRATLQGSEDLARFARELLSVEDLAETYVRSGVPDEQWSRVLRACPLPEDPRR